MQSELFQSSPISAGDSALIPIFKLLLDTSHLHRNDRSPNNERARDIVPGPFLQPCSLDCVELFSTYHGAQTASAYMFPDAPDAPYQTVAHVVAVSGYESTISASPYSAGLM